MSYTRVGWVDVAEGEIPSSSTPAIDADNLKHMEDGIVNSVCKDGDTMVGDLILNGDPTTSLQAATKNYVDNNVLYFCTPSIDANTSSNERTTTFKIPDNVDLTKYSCALVYIYSVSNSNTLTSATTSILPFDKYLNLAESTSSNYIRGEINTANRTFAVTVDGWRSKINCKILFIPTPQETTLSILTN